MSGPMATSGLALGDLGARVTGFAIDHRKVAPGCVFGAFQGATVNGEDFIESAIANGAIAVVARPEAKVEGALHLADPNPRARFARLAAEFFAPFPKVTAAVTGTNGKTSTVELTRQLWHLLGERAASIGTLGVTTAEDRARAGMSALTTPDIVTFLATAGGLAREGITHLAFELSWHHGGLFRGQAPAVHRSGRTASAGRGLCRRCSRRGRLQPRDHGKRAGARPAPSRLPTRLGQRLKLSHAGTTHEMLLPLIGGYQAANALVALGLVTGLGASFRAALDALSRVQPIRGRLERAVITGAGAPVYIDYAHTPDALAAATRCAGGRNGRASPAHGQPADPRVRLRR